MNLNKKVYVYGCSQNGKKVYEQLSSFGMNCCGFVDRDANKIGSIDINGKIIKCYELNDLIENQEFDSIIFVANREFWQVAGILKKNGFKNVYRLNDLVDIDLGDYFTPPKIEVDDYVFAHPFHWHDSPYADIRYIIENKHRLYDKQKEINDIDFNEENQIAFLKEMSKVDLPNWKDFKTPEYRYHYNNGSFESGSVNALYYMIIKYKPKHIIEIGSGWSTAAMLDVNEYYMNNAVDIQCIEPFADRLRSTLKPTDNIFLNECYLQEMSLDFFDKLEKNDILFIDSSHVCKPGSDVSMEIFDILPRLKSGVLIHFHDIFWPFEYPIEWIREGRAFNELFLLRAFLMNNNDYDILLFGDQINTKHLDRIPVSMRDCGSGSIWMMKR